MSLEGLENALFQLTIQEQNSIVRRVNIRRQTVELRERLPQFLKPFAETISVREPVVKHKVKARGAANAGRITYDGEDAFISIGPNFTRLDVGCSKWTGDHTYLTGTAGFSKAHVWLGYQKVYAQAAVTEYGYPGGDIYWHVSRRVKEMVRRVVKEIGFEEEISDGQCVEVLEAMMGERGKEVLDESVVKGEPKLRDVVRDDLDKNKESGCC